VKKPIWVIGIDEVGRGSVAGPVAVCACAIKLDKYKNIKLLELTDSKKMTPINREEWYKKAITLKQNKNIDYSVAYKTNRYIDKNGISLAIKKCIATVLKNLKLDAKDCIVLLDGGLRAPENYLNQKTIIKGDLKEKIISFASVIAKVSRDKKMSLLSKTFPEYLWKNNKGYGTKDHYIAIEKYGITNLHRKTFLKNISSTKEYRHQ
jgi:ribonuclease HII